MSDDLPRFDMKGILRRRDRLMTRCVEPRLNEQMTGENLHALAASVRGNLPNGITRDTVFESVRYLAGKQLTRREGFELCWRLAGNSDLLREGTPVGPWTAQTKKEWIPLQILRAIPFRNNRNRSGYNFDFRVLAGSPCPMKIQTFWSRDLVRMMATRMGFSNRRRGLYQFHHGTELVGLRLVGELDPLRSQYSPTFYEVAVPSSFVTWNRETVLRIRCRVEPCPRGFVHACRQCAVGYSECIAGTHRQNYEQRFCGKCGETKWFDLDLTVERCMDCQHKELLARND